MSGPPPPYLQLTGITKRFGRFVANDQIDLAVPRGTIHAILGENGAGKTTLMNLLCGLYQPDAGTINLQGQPVQLPHPRAAIRHGIGMIHQHFMLVPQLTVAENLILGLPGRWRLRLRQQADAIAQMAESYGLPIDPLARVGELPVGLQQRVAILKALQRQARLLILDEPTAVLTPGEVAQLFKVLRQLAAQHHTILFISHKLDEVLELCDAVTVLRAGRAIATTATQGVQPAALARLMVGHDLPSVIAPSASIPGPVVLAVQDLQVQDQRGLPAVRGVSFQLRAGEILGLAGVDGNGQRELADAIAGLRPITHGRLHWPQQPQGPTRLGYIPEDRQHMGLVLPFSIARNLILKAFWRRPFARHGWLQPAPITNQAQQAIHAFDIRARGGWVPVNQLSGGNQQKVVLARELAGDPAVIVAMQPTRGLDVGATRAVQEALLAARSRGVAILYISTELEEIITLSDRIGVLFQGQLKALLSPQQTTKAQLGLLMAGGTLSQ